MYTEKETDTNAFKRERLLTGVKGEDFEQINAMCGNNNHIERRHAVRRRSARRGEAISRGAKGPRKKEKAESDRDARRGNWAWGPMFSKDFGLAASPSLGILTPE